MFDWLGLNETACKVAGLDVGVGSDDDLCTAAVEIERVRGLLDAAQGSVLAELDARGVCDRDHGLRTNTWLARQCGLARGTATARLRVGQTLRAHLPATAARLASGDISWDHARVMADAINPRIEQEFAEIEQSLLDLATGTVFERWRDHVRDVANILDQDGGYDPTDDLERNSLHITPCTDGITYLKATLIGAGAEAAKQCIDRVADELFRQYTSDHAITGGEVAIPNRATLRALAFIEICRRATAAQNAETSSTRPEVTLVINAEDIDEHGVHAVHSPTGVRLQGGGLCSLTCDMSMFPLVVDSLGVPLDMGREIRTANRAQRRALAVRDGGCIFPGCGAHPEHCDAHHVRHWTRDLGTTDVFSMALLCRHHHGVVHRRGWRIDLDDDGWATITTPGGATLGGQRHGTTRAGPAPPLAT